MSRKQRYFLKQAFLRSAKSLKNAFNVFHFSEKLQVEVLFKGFFKFIGYQSDILKFWNICFQGTPLSGCLLLVGYTIWQQRWIQDSVSCTLGLFVTVSNSFQPLTIVTTNSFLHDAAVLYPPLSRRCIMEYSQQKNSCWRKSSS